MGAIRADLPLYTGKSHALIIRVDESSTLSRPICDVRRPRAKCGETQGLRRRRVRSSSRLASPRLGSCGDPLSENGSHG
jgi:hypothetical protein